VSARINIKVDSFFHNGSSSKTWCCSDHRFRDPSTVDAEDEDIVRSKCWAVDVSAGAHLRAGMYQT
jgi:hypothetical protein